MSVRKQVKFSCCMKEAYKDHTSRFTKTEKAQDSTFSTAHFNQTICIVESMLCMGNLLIAFLKHPVAFLFYGVCTVK